MRYQRLKEPLKKECWWDWNFYQTLSASPFSDVIEDTVRFCVHKVGQQFELIYSQSGLLYNILPDAPHSILDKTRQRVGPQANGIVGSAQTKLVEQLTK